MPWVFKAIGIFLALIIGIVFLVELIVSARILLLRLTNNESSSSMLLNLCEPQVEGWVPLRSVNLHGYIPNVTLGNTLPDGTKTIDALILAGYLRNAVEEFEKKSVYPEPQSLKTIVDLILFNRVIFPSDEIPFELGSNILKMGFVQTAVHKKVLNQLIQVQRSDKSANGMGFNGREKTCFLLGAGISLEPNNVDFAFSICPLFAAKELSEMAHNGLEKKRRRI